VISLMMIVDLLLLALAVWFAMRLLRTARQQGRPSIDDGLHPESAAVLVDLVSESETPARPDRFAPFETEDPKLTFAAEASLSSLDQANQDDLYADPIDGVPFTAGEEIHTCRCGVGYRRESLRWIGENLSGQCVHCGVAMNALQVVAVCHAGPREVRVQ
jgi:hypothetical protein